MPRFMIIVPASKESESGELPSAEALTKMGKFNEDLVKAGVMLAGDGLHPTSKGARVVFDGKTTKVVDGPFSEAKELIAGYWIWQCKSREEAIEWLKRAPFNEIHNGTTVLEIRQIFSPEDFAPVDPTGELRRKEEELRTQVEQQKRS